MILKDSKIRLLKKDFCTYGISLLLKTDRFSILFDSPENFTLHEAKQRMIILATELELDLDINIEDI